MLVVERERLHRDLAAAGLQSPFYTRNVEGNHS